MKIENTVNFDVFHCFDITSLFLPEEFLLNNTKKGLHLLEELFENSIIFLLPITLNSGWNKKNI